MYPVLFEKSLASFKLTTCKINNKSAYLIYLNVINNKLHKIESKKETSTSQFSFVVYKMRFRIVMDASGGDLEKK